MVNNYNPKMVSIDSDCLDFLKGVYSLQSVAAYFKPTISDAIEVKTDFTRTLYDIIPELKR